MSQLYPLRFQPILRRYIWGGRRLGAVLAKPIGPESDYAESWEICDHDADQSRVAFGPLKGVALAELVGERGAEVLGRHHPQPRFPLLVKFLDAARTLSVQVHPNDTQAAQRIPPDLGKSEAWVVLAAEPASAIYAGLRPGIDRQQLDEAVRAGTCESCLHRFEAAPGDCVYLPAGTVHALGEGLLIAEIQQASDVTYRLFDWNRLGPDGKPRPLHIEQALEVVDYARGPVNPQTPRPTDRPWAERLVECEKFLLDRCRLDMPRTLGGDRRCHILCVLEGAVRVDGDPADRPLRLGETMLLPAAAGEVGIRPEGYAVVLDAYLPGPA